MCKCRRARCSDCVSGRATGRVNIIKKKKGVIKQSIAHRRSPWLCQPLWRRKHFNSPLSSICACGGSHGCRRPLFITTDRSQICWFAELWEEDGGGGEWGCEHLKEWEMEQARRWGQSRCISHRSSWQFHPCLISSYQSSLAESRANWPLW